MERWRFIAYLSISAIGGAVAILFVHVVPQWAFFVLLCPSLGLGMWSWERLTRLRGTSPTRFGTNHSGTHPSLVELGEAELKLFQMNLSLSDRDLRRRLRRLVILWREELIVLGDPIPGSGLSLGYSKPYMQFGSAFGDASGVTLEFNTRQYTQAAYRQALLTTLAKGAWMKRLRTELEQAATKL